MMTNFAFPCLRCSLRLPSPAFWRPSSLFSLLSSPSFLSCWISSPFYPWISCFSLLSSSSSSPPSHLHRHRLYLSSCFYSSSCSSSSPPQPLQSYPPQHPEPLHHPIPPSCPPRPHPLLLRLPRFPHLF